MTWDINQSNSWYEKQAWLVGCNFIPSSAINQLEMFQEETFDEETIEREIAIARDLGFNSLRIYLHDLLWNDRDSLKHHLNIVLNICVSHEIKPILVFFDDCHRAYPKLGIQPKPVRGVHNSGWKQSPGLLIVHEIFDNTVKKQELERLRMFVQEVMDEYKDDDRILMWDIYNEPGQFPVGERSLTLLKHTWAWAQEVRPSQPLTSCLDGSVGSEIIKYNQEKSDIITFHQYESDKLLESIVRLKKLGRPVICTEYMARELGTTFEFSLPIFRENRVGCYNWGLVAGKSQTHFPWSSVQQLQKLKKEKVFLEDYEDIPEPEIWFHDIFRKDGSAFNEDEVVFIKKILER